MTVSRRGFMAGLALTGAAALPVAYYTHRHLTREEEPQTPDEASLDLAATDGIRLGDRLRGLWDLRLVGGDAELPGLPREGLQLVLDVAPKGRGLIGYLDTPERLLAAEPPRFRVLGDLLGASSASIRWRLVDQASGSVAPTHDCSAVFDEVWADYANAGDGTLSGRIQRLERSPLSPNEDFRFVAVKRHFPWPMSASCSTRNFSVGWCRRSTDCSTSYGTLRGTNGIGFRKNNAMRCAESVGSPARWTANAMREGRARIAMPRVSTSFSCTGTCCTPRVPCRTCRPGSVCRDLWCRWSTIVPASSVTSTIRTGFRASGLGGSG